MDKKELVRTLDNMLPILRELETKNDELERIQNRLATIENQAQQKDMAKPLVMFFMGAIIGNIIIPMLGLVIGGGIGGAIGWIFYRKKGAAQEAERQQKLQFEYGRLEAVRKETAQNIYDFIQPHYEWITGIVPEKYAYTYCVERLRDYLITGRADSMKEAFNLYENELHRMRMEQQMDAMMEEIQEQSRQIYALREEVAEANRSARRAEAAAYRR